MVVDLVEMVFLAWHLTAYTRPIDHTFALQE